VFYNISRNIRNLQFYRPSLLQTRAVNAAHRFSRHGSLTRLMETRVLIGDPFSCCQHAASAI